MNKSRYPLDPWIEGYLEYLAEVCRKAPGTVRDVRCTLRRVGQTMASIRPEVPLWHLKLEDYLRWLEAERTLGRSARTLTKNISHLRGLLDYTWRSGRCDRNVFDGFYLQDARHTQPPPVLNLEEAKRLVEACPRSTALDRCSRVIILLLYGCGLRTSELCGLNVQDVDRERRELLVLRGKGDRQRCVPIPEGVFVELLAYLGDRGGVRGALFRTGPKRCRIRARHISQVVREAALRAGITWHVTAKTLRHTFATHLMDRGVDLAIIASLMGHRSPKETGVYLHGLPGRPQEAVRGLARRREEHGGA